MPQHYSNPTSSKRDPEFEHSWQQLLASGREIIDLATTSKHQQCRMLLNTREQLSHNHFAQFPVGPENRDRYRQRLSELFRQEQEIDRVKTELRGRAPGSTPYLRLVK